MCPKVPEEVIYNKPMVDITEQCCQDETLYPVQGQKREPDQNPNKNNQVTERRSKTKNKITLMVVTTLFLVVLAFSLFFAKVLSFDKHKTITG